MQQKKKILTIIKDAMMLERKSKKTIAAYLRWIKEYIIFNGIKHPSELGADHIRDYLNYLVQERHVSAETQKQAFHSILYGYKTLGIRLNRIEGIQKPKRTKRLPARSKSNYYK